MACTAVKERPVRDSRYSPKARRTRSLPLPRFLRPELAAHVAGKHLDERVFTASRGGPLRNSNFRHYVFDPAVARAGLAPLTPHDLRDTAASLAVSAGANVKTVNGCSAAPRPR